MQKRSCSRQEIEDEQEKAPKPKIVHQANKVYFKAVKKRVHMKKILNGYYMLFVSPQVQEEERGIHERGVPLYI